MPTAPPQPWFGSNGVSGESDLPPRLNHPAMFSKVLPAAMFAALFCGAIAYKNLTKASPAPSTAEVTATPTVMGSGLGTPSGQPARFHPSSSPSMSGFEHLSSSGVLSGAPPTPSQGSQRRGGAIPSGINPVGMSFLSGDRRSHSPAPVEPGGMTTNPFVK